MTNTEWPSISLDHIQVSCSRKNKRLFLRWADKNGWQPYDSNETWIKVKNRWVLSISNLYRYFKAEQNHE